MTGQKFGRLTVLSRNPQKGHTVFWDCVCDCGNKTRVSSINLLRGRIKSCGCLHDDLSRERAKKQFTKHGLRSTRLYSIWASMNTRCYNPNSRSYKHYGERGVKVCEEWKTFTNFYDWALGNGYREDLTLDRIDCNGNYDPQNCRWATTEMQCNNKRNSRFVTINGERHTLSEWSKISGVHRRTISDRIAKGYPENEWLKKPCCLTIQRRSKMH